MLAREIMTQRGNAMDALKISAQFAAYTWYMEMKDEATPAKEEGVRFARDNATAFSSCAHEGLGRLLIRLAAGGRRTPRRRSRAAEPSSQL
jgi:hypothetical protein